MSREQVEPVVQQLFYGHDCARMMASVPDHYRERLLSVEVLCLAMLNFVLAKMSSFVALVDDLQSGKIPGLRALRISHAAFYKRLRTIPHTVFLGLLSDVTQALRSTRRHRRDWVAALAPFANGIFAIDDTTLDAFMRRTKSLKEHPKGAMETLGGRLGCALDLTTGAYAEVLYDPDSEANEKNHIKPLVERLGAGNLYVFDLGYFAFPFFDYLTEHYCYFVTRLRSKTSFKVITTLADGPHYRDRIIYLGQYRADRAAYPVRLVELFVDGKWWPYITNMLDPQMLPAEKIWALYGQRWTIEMSFAAVKRSLGMAYLHACHRNGVLIQIWCTLAVYQILQDVRLDIIATNRWEDDEVSWHNLMARVASYVRYPQLNTTDLRTWLVDNAPNLALKKRGTRKRRRERLPEKTLQACRRKPKPPDLAVLVPSKARQSKPQPRKKTSEIVVGGLS